MKNQDNPIIYYVWREINKITNDFKILRSNEQDSNGFPLLRKP